MSPLSELQVVQAAAPQALQLELQAMQLPADNRYPVPQEVQVVLELQARHPSEQAWQSDRSTLEPL